MTKACLKSIINEMGMKDRFCRACFSYHYKQQQYCPTCGGCLHTLSYLKSCYTWGNLITFCDTGLMRAKEKLR